MAGEDFLAKKLTWIKVPAPPAPKITDPSIPNKKYKGTLGAFSILPNELLGQIYGYLAAGVTYNICKPQPTDLDNLAHASPKLRYLIRNWFTVGGDRNQKMIWSPSDCVATIPWKYTTFVIDLVGVEAWDAKLKVIEFTKHYPDLDKICYIRLWADSGSYLGITALVFCLHGTGDGGYLQKFPALKKLTVAIPAEFSCTKEELEASGTAQYMGIKKHDAIRYEIEVRASQTNEVVEIPPVHPLDIDFLCGAWHPGRLILWEEEFHGCCCEPVMNYFRPSDDESEDEDGTGDEDEDEEDYEETDEDEDDNDKSSDHSSGDNSDESPDNREEEKKRFECFNPNSLGQMLQSLGLTYD